MVSREEQRGKREDRYVKEIIEIIAEYFRNGSQCKRWHFQINTKINRTILDNGYAQINKCRDAIIEYVDSKMNMISFDRKRNDRMKRKQKMMTKETIKQQLKSAY